MMKRLLTYLAAVAALTLAGATLGALAFGAATAPAPSVVGAAVAFCLSVVCAVGIEAERHV